MYSRLQEKKTYKSRQKVQTETIITVISDGIDGCKTLSSKLIAKKTEYIIFLNINKNL